MLKRLGPVAMLVTLIAVALLAAPASAQTPPPLAGVVEQLDNALDQAQPAFDALKPVTDQLAPPLAQAVNALQPLITQLNGIVSQAKPACVVLGPVLDAVQPAIAQVQPLLDVTANPPDQVALLKPVLATVNGLVTQALHLCSAATPAAAKAGASAPVATGSPGSLPLTGGPILAVPALAALGLGGALRAARRRLD
ncbi:MAG: hypothetical protein JF603_09395 [Acidobacteria bacterium]|nr:hypothetical protein [Acidobacteriota bacterium]